MEIEELEFKLRLAKPTQIDANPFDLQGPGNKDRVLNTENLELSASTSPRPGILEFSTKSLGSGSVPTY